MTKIEVQTLLSAQHMEKVLMRALLAKNAIVVISKRK